MNQGADVERDIVDTTDPRAGRAVVHISPEVSIAAHEGDDPFRTYPPPFDLTSDMLFVAAFCPAAPLREHFPEIPFLTIFGKTMLIMWFSRITELCYHSTAGVPRCAETYEGVPYNELNVITLLRRRAIFVPEIYATSDLTLMLGHRYGMPKQATQMHFEAGCTEIRSRVTDGQRESFVRACLFTSGRWFGRLLSRLLPLWTWLSLFPNGSFIRAFIQDVPRVQFARIISGQLTLREPWLPFTINLLPLGVFIPGLRMRLPTPETHG